MSSSLSPRSGSAMNDGGEQSFGDSQQARDSVGDHEEASGRVSLDDIHRSGSLIQDSCDNGDSDYSDWYHGLMQARESEDILSDKPPGSFVVRKEITNQLIITYRSSPTKIKHVLVPDKSSELFKDFPELQTVKDVVNDVISHIPHLSSPVKPEASHETPHLKDSVDQGDIKSLPGGFCVVCEASVHGLGQKMCHHLRQHRIYKCPRCKCVILGYMYAKHSGRCKGASPENYIVTREKNVSTYSKNDQRNPLKSSAGLTPNPSQASALDTLMDEMGPGDIVNDSTNSLLNPVIAGQDNTIQPSSIPNPNFQKSSSSSLTVQDQKQTRRTKDKTVKMKESKFNVKVVLKRKPSSKKKTMIRHSSKCFVCDGKTDIMTKCSSCPNVFHKNCLGKEEKLSSEWRCPGCRLQGVVFKCSDCDSFSSRWYSSYCAHIRKHCRGKIPQFERRHICEMAQMSRYSNSVLAEFLIYIRNEVLGPRFFSCGIKKVLKQNLNCFKPFTTSSIVTVKDKEGDSMKTVLVELKDPVSTIDMIAEGRGVKEAAYSVQIDGGNSKVISTINIFETSPQPQSLAKGEKKRKEFKEGGCRRSIIATAIDDAPESRETLELALNPILPIVRRKSALLTGDNKAQQAIYGIQQTSSTHPCTSCTSYRVDKDTGLPSKGGPNCIWVVEGVEMRSFSSQMKDHLEVERLSAGKSSEERQEIVKLYNNQANRPIQVSDDPDLLNVFKSPGDPLHNVKLGPNNKLMGELDKCFRSKMTYFYKCVGINRKHSGQVASNWNGPQLSRIIAHRSLLVNILPKPLGQLCSTFLKWSDLLYKLLVAKELDKEWRNVFKNYLHYYDLLIMNGFLTPSLKYHHIKDHYPFILEQTGKTLRLADCSACESSHSSLRRNERTHMSKTVTNIGGPEHLKRFLNSIAWWNSKNLGYVMPENQPSPAATQAKDGKGGGGETMNNISIHDAAQGLDSGGGGGSTADSPAVQIVIDPYQNKYNVELLAQSCSAMAESSAPPQATVPISQGKTVINKQTRQQASIKREMEKNIPSVRKKKGSSLATASIKRKLEEQEDNFRKKLRCPPTPPPTTEVLCIYPADSKRTKSKAVTLFEADYMCLEENVWINDNIVDFYLLYLFNEKLPEDTKPMVHIFTSMFYKRLTTSYTSDETGSNTSEKKYSRVKGWTKNINIFEKKMLIFPICEDGHWTLVIAVQPFLVGVPEKERPNDVKPFLLLLDSMGYKQYGAVTNIRHYLAQEWANKEAVKHNGQCYNFDSKSIKSLRPKKPEQTNYSDCAIYLLHYVEKIFESFAQFFYSNKIEKMTQNWFSVEEVSMKRRSIARIIDGLAREHEEQFNTSMPVLTEASGLDQNHDCPICSFKADDSVALLNHVNDCMLTDHGDGAQLQRSSSSVIGGTVNAFNGKTGDIVGSKVNMSSNGVEVETEANDGSRTVASQQINPPTSVSLPPGHPQFEVDLPPDLLKQGWTKHWSEREKRPYFFNKMNGKTEWKMPTIPYHLKLTENSVVGVPRGLCNLGNTCYMNSILQCLESTPPLAHYILSRRYKADLNRESKTRGHVIEEFAKVLEQLWSSKLKSIRPVDLKSIVGRYNQSFAEMTQQDSQEFLSSMLDWLKEEVNRASKPNATPGQIVVDNGDISAARRHWVNFVERNQSVIDKLFCGQTRSVVKCFLCKGESVTYSHFTMLTLPLPEHTNKTSVKECLELYLKESFVSDYKCGVCDRSGKASTKTDIVKLPSYLIIHLSRFQQTMTGTRKKYNIVQFDLNDVNFGHYGLSGFDNRHHRFNLYAVSNHIGNLHHGHYTAHCYSKNHKKWHQFDDQNVTVMAPSPHSTAAYILFYSSLESTLT